MERNITITLEKAREWYNSDNESLKEVALQAFDEAELVHSFKNITTFKDACRVLGLDYEVESAFIEDIKRVSKSSAAIFKLNIVRKALNLGYDLSLTKNPCVYYPFNPFIKDGSTHYKDELNSGKMEVIGKFKSEGTSYMVIGGSDVISDGGLGRFHSKYGVGYAHISAGFLGCATKEIAQHFGKYFGMLITEAKYADMVDFEIIENKY